LPAKETPVKGPRIPHKVASLVANTNDERGSTQRGRSRAFTLIDVLVSIGVIAVLIGIILPSYGKAREAAHRIVCGSNLRQLGIGVASYAQDNRDIIPHSVFLSPYGDRSATPQVQDMVVIRTDSKAFRKRPWGQWDGIGMLFNGDYTPAAKIYYCPSHSGDHPYERYAQQWLNADDGEIVSNYQYRGKGPNGSFKLDQINPQTAALVTDGMRTLEDFNHEVGVNVLRAGGNVDWMDDQGGFILSLLSRSASSTDPGDLGVIWGNLDAD